MFSAKLRVLNWEFPSLIPIRPTWISTSFLTDFNREGCHFKFFCVYVTQLLRHLSTDFMILFCWNQLLWWWKWQSLKLDFYKITDIYSVINFSKLFMIWVFWVGPGSNTDSCSGNHSTGNFLVREHLVWLSGTCIIIIWM